MMSEPSEGPAKDADRYRRPETAEQTLNNYEELERLALLYGVDTGQPMPKMKQKLSELGVEVSHIDVE